MCVPSVVSVLARVCVCVCVCVMCFGIYNITRRGMKTLVVLSLVLCTYARPRAAGARAPSIYGFTLYSLYWCSVNR